jgi:hypothetical protein
MNTRYDADSALPSRSRARSRRVEFTFPTADGPVHCRTSDVSWNALKQ